MESPEVITIPDLNKPFVVHCGATELGLGRALYQQEERKLKGISYTSSILLPAEKNYHLHRGKLKSLALQWALAEKYHD